MEQNQLFNFENPYRKSVWAKALDFDGLGQQIRITNYQVLLKGEGEPPAQFVDDQWNGTYRLSFLDATGDEKHYENRYHDFNDDLKEANIKPNQLGILRRERDGRRWKWSWQPIQE